MHKFVNVNTAIGALTAIANGGAAMMMLGDPARYPTFKVIEASVFATVGFSLVVLGVLLLAGRASLARTLAWQAGSLACLLALLTFWGFTILLTSPDQRLAVSWMVGVLSALAVYVFFLLRQVTDVRKFESFRRPLLVACAVAIAVDFGVFVRVGWV
jgi:hypothetical protein